MDRLINIEHTLIQDERPKNWYWDYKEVFFSDLSANAKLVRMCLAMHADHHDRRAFPSLNRIAKECSISKSSVIRAIKELEDKGWIKRQQRKLASSNYVSTVYLLLAPPNMETNLPSDNEGCVSEKQPVSERTGLSSADTTFSAMGVVSQENNPIHGEMGSVIENQGLSPCDIGVVSQGQGGCVTSGLEQDPYNKIQRTTTNEQTAAMVSCCPAVSQTDFPDENAPPAPVRLPARAEGGEDTDRVAGEIATRLGVPQTDATRLANALVPGFGAAAVLNALAVAEQTLEKKPIDNLERFLRAAITENWTPPVAVPARKRPAKTSKYADIYRT